MHRYLLKFYKKDNMRFISHLDLQTLFHRAIRRGGVDVAFSNGFNPHELMNIVQPLSLGYEGLAELVELDTLTQYDTNDLIELLNPALPDGIRFYECVETERKNKNTCFNTNFAEYRVSFNDSNTIDDLKISDFTKLEEIIIMKRDKKTKEMVPKNVKSLVHVIKTDGDCLYIKVSCGSNRTVNPTNLLSALFEFSGKEFKQEECRIIRTAILE